MPLLHLTPRERALAALVLAFAACAILAPPIAQAGGYHAFADRNTLAGVPHALNVLSNIPLALVGVAILWRLAGRAAAVLHGAERALLVLAGIGLLATAVGSAWYHLDPGDAGLAVDRAAMCVLFAAVLGLAGCRISRRAGIALAVALLVAGPAALQPWSVAGNLTPWIVVQGGGMLLLAGLALLRAGDGAFAVNWGWVLAGYALAKLLELGDHAVWAATGEVVSGHSLKHLLSALCLMPVVHALGRLRPPVQNAPQPQPQPQPQA